MLATNEQLKIFVEGVFAKHAATNPNVLSIAQLYGFFCNFFTGTPLKITLADVQHTLKLVHTASLEKITKREMYEVLKLLAVKKKEVLKECPNRSLKSEDKGDNKYKYNKENSKPEKDINSNIVKTPNNSVGLNRNLIQKKNNFISPEMRPSVPNPTQGKQTVPDLR